MPQKEKAGDASAQCECWHWGGWRVPQTVVWEAEPRQHLRLRTEPARERGQALNIFLGKRSQCRGVIVEVYLHLHIYSLIFHISLHSEL